MRGNSSFDPRLPAGWPSLTFMLRWRGSRLRVALTQTDATFTVEETGESDVPITVRGREYAVRKCEPVHITLDGHGPRQGGTLGTRPIIGGRRPDGSRITAGVPAPSTPAGKEVGIDAKPDWEKLMLSSGPVRPLADGNEA